MTDEPRQSDALRPLLIGLVDDRLDGPQHRQLADLLHEDAAARTYYLQYMLTDAMLRLEHGGNEERTANSEVVSARTEERGTRNEERPVIAAGETSLPGSSFSVPSFPTIHYPLSTIHSFVGGVLFSYIVASLIFGVALLAGWFYKVSYDTQVARQSPPSAAELKLAPAPKIEFVGRITGMIDCQWADPHTAVPGPVAVPLGRRYALSSGLMEITYDTGAKVILQGPATYEVESASGGYLAVGKLTARLEQKGEGGRRKAEATGNQKSEISNQKSPFPLPPSPFVVRTPAATVTDLGTEFAVEVKPEGPVEVQVFQGKVETARQGPPGAAPLTERLVAGEAIRFASAAAAPERIPFRLARLTTNSLHAIPKARSASLLAPVGLVATAYHRVWSLGGKLAAESDRQQAFRVVTDGVFGRGENGRGPLSSFDTLDANRSKTDFVGLLYGRPVRFDRIKVFLGRQSGEGGNWRELPRAFILKNLVDTDQTPPENDPANWRELPLQIRYGQAFGGRPGVNPGAVLEFVLTAPAQDRTGYGWAIGGVDGDGRSGCVSVTELRAYGAEVTEK